MIYLKIKENNNSFKIINYNKVTLWWNLIKFSKINKEKK